MGQGASTDAIFQKNVDKFMELNPNIKVNVEIVPWDGAFDKIMTAVNTNTTPDMLETTPSMVSQLAEMGKLANVDDVYEAKKASGELDNWIMSAADNFKYKGSWYALPVGVIPHFIYYRPDLFKKLGVDVPAEWTWEALDAAAKKLTVKSDGVQYYGICGEAGEFQSTEQHLFGWLAQGGGGFFDKTGKLNLTSEENVKAVEFAAHIYKDYSPPDVAAWSANEAWTKMQEGTSAIFFSGGWFGYPLQKLFGVDNIKAITFTGPGGRFTRSEGEPIMIFKSSSNIDACKKFVSFISETDQMLNMSKGDLGWLPIQKSALDDPELKNNPLFVDILTQVLPYGQMMSYPSPEPVPAEGTLEAGLVFSKILDQVILGKKTAAESLAEAQKLGEEMIGK